jgi:membrane protein
MILMLWLTAEVGPELQDALLGQFATLAGNDARLAALAVIESVKQRRGLGSIPGALGVGGVLIGATSVFAQLQASFNFIWDVTPRKTNAVWAWRRRRWIFSVGVLLVIGFVLIVSTLVSSALGFFLFAVGRSGRASTKSFRS